MTVKLRSKGLAVQSSDENNTLEISRRSYKIKIFGCITTKKRVLASFLALSSMAMIFTGCGGKLVADEFYYGESRRVPAKLFFEKECYLVTSELKDDFYREF